MLFSGEIVETQTVNVAALDPAALAKSVERLAQILRACVHEGASIGFVMPFEHSEAREYWLDRVAAPHAAGSKLVLIATLGDAIAGTAQLDLDSMPSKRHHAEVSKVLVDPAFRRAGVGRALMQEIERRAAKEGRWLLTLDTAGDAAEALYRSLGLSASRAQFRITRATPSKKATTRRGLCTKTSRRIASSPQRC